MAKIRFKYLMQITRMVLSIGILARVGNLDTKMLPGLYTHESHHFFRHSFAEFGLNGWDALRAVALAGKTEFAVDRKLVVFSGDPRVKPPAVPPSSDFLNDNN